MSRITSCIMFCVLAFVSVAASGADKPTIDENFIVIYSDIHCGPDGYQKEAFLKRVNELLAMNPRPAHLLIYGDFALSFGLKEDYESLKPIMKKIEDAGIRWDVAMGNHDRRNHFSQVFPDRKTAAPEVPNRYISMVDTPHAQFILLDSLIEGKVYGEIDPQQAQWLDKTLAAAKKPVFVGCHHPLNETKLDHILKKHQMFAGYIYGHNHYWRPVYQNGIPMLCLPSTGHWGDIGYVKLRLSPRKAEFELRELDFFVVQYSPKRAIKRYPEDAEIIKRKNGAKFVLPLPCL